MRKHGMHNTRTYHSWEAMIQRCNNPKVHNFAHYGGRGISVCSQWADFITFYADMGERPEGTSLDRIDNDGNYGPGNCRWSTQSEQNGNQRPRGISGYIGVSYGNNNKWRARIKVDGKKQSLGSFDTAEQASAAYLAAKNVGCVT